jgi:RNA polymerase sigma-70 factor (ECF subfamily)
VAEEALRAAEAAARASYGRLIAFLAARSRDVAAAEDALGDALRAALEKWPRDGVPNRPEAWLLTAARRRLIDRRRHERAQDDARDVLTTMITDSDPPGVIPDKRLELLFVCAHPAIDAAVRTPLMLQAVLGLDAARIGAAFLVPPGTMGQRLVRAKSKIRDAGIAFEVPEKAELAPRIEAVLEAIYGCYGVGWDEAMGADAAGRDLVDEAMWLARLVAELLPDEPEAKGLLALILHCEARRHARRTRDGRYVPLSQQDTSLWSRPMMVEAESWLAEAARCCRLGRFQLEAAIQSAHAERARSGTVDWGSIEHLYAGLTAIAPSVGAQLGHAVAVAEVQDAATALSLLDGLPMGSVIAHQPYWAVRADLLRRLGRREEARGAYERALSLTQDGAVRQFLMARLEGVVDASPS